MARTTIERFTDDIDGSAEGVETVSFGLHGAVYEVDLNKANQEALEEALQPFLAVARKAGGPVRRPSPRTSGSASGGTGVDARAVRAWAAEHDIQVSPRGRINAAVLEQYRSATA